MTPKRIRVLHLITGLSLGGAETMLSRLIEAMDPAAFDQRVLCLGADTPLAQDLRERGVPTLCLDLKRHPARLRHLVPSFGSDSAWRPQILQGWMYHGNLAAYLGSRLLGRRAKLSWNIRVGLDTMSTYRATTRALIRLGAWLSPSTDRIIFNSAAACRQHEARGYCSERSLLIPNGFDLDRFKPSPEARLAVRQELGLPADAPLLGQFARLHAEKNQALFLSSLAALPRDVHGVLAGRGIQPGDPALSAVITRYGLEGRIHLLGERSDLARLTAALDIAVSPSWNEGFSNTLGEALACGVPCVATAVGESAALVGQAGITVPPGDAPAMVAALRSLLALAPEGRVRLGALGRRRMEAEFSMEHVARQYEMLYLNLMQSPF